MTIVRTTDVETMLQISYNALYRWIKSVGLTVIEVTTRVRFLLVSELEKLLGIKIRFDEKGTPFLVEV